MLPVDVPPFGAYVHVPFCAKRCDYCAFATWTDRDHLMVEYSRAVVQEIGRAVATGLAPSSSVFFGGGTPSLLAPALLTDILDAIPRTSDAEVTVECNPDTVGPELFAAYVAHGVNRVSFGVQSMVPAVLASLGRTHDPQNVVRAVTWAREAGIETLNLDLIYGVAGERVTDWEATLRGVLALDPPLVSAYALTVEAGTPLAADHDRHPDDDDQADKYDLANELLGADGLANYEVSNWAVPGHECRHNWLYWAQGDYRGFGCAAHSHEQGRRFWNVRTPERYLALVGAGASPEGGSETLDAPARRLEQRQLALRTRAGVPAASFPESDLAELVEARLVTVEAGQAVLTPHGRLMGSAVSLRLI